MYVDVLIANVNFPQRFQFVDFCRSHEYNEETEWARAKITNSTNSAILLAMLVDFMMAQLNKGEFEMIRPWPSVCG